MIRKVSRWALPLAACAIIAIAAVKATEAKQNLEFDLDRTPITRNEGVYLSYSSVVKKVRPSIVSISTSKTVQAQNTFGDGMSPFGDDLFRRFFGDRGFGSPQQQTPQKRTGLGSGVIVSKDGYILTNNHVVDGSEEIKVTLNGSDKEFDAKIVGADSRSDIAVLKIDAENLPIATLGDSDLVEDGDVVLAFGNPFGVGQTVTMGIVSATGRNKTRQ
jgi:serine protease Do